MVGGRYVTCLKGKQAVLHFYNQSVRLLRANITLLLCIYYNTFFPILYLLIRVDILLSSVCLLHAIQTYYFVVVLGASQTCLKFRGWYNFSNFMQNYMRKIVKNAIFYWQISIKSLFHFHPMVEAKAKPCFIFPTVDALIFSA